jgi:ssDNA-binding Zn-finger/Zn-ribbon topoisomerase 1
MEEEERGAATCPRCGGQFHALRRFTRAGRTVVVLLCRDCRYTKYEPSSQAAL